MGFLGRRGLALAFTAVIAVCWVGCGGGEDDNPADNSGNYDISLSCGNRACKSAVMPDGKTWMTENVNRTTDNSGCYLDSCAKYGRVYTWNAAKIVCPSGWHLPTRDEWGALAKAAGGTGDYGADGTAGTALKSKSGWEWDYVHNKNGNGTDDYGFSALPNGCGKNGGEKYGMWWTATEDGEDYAYNRVMSFKSDNVEEGGGDHKDSRKDIWASVRCVKGD